MRAVRKNWETKRTARHWKCCRSVCSLRYCVFIKHVFCCCWCCLLSTCVPLNCDSQLRRGDMRETDTSLKTFFKINKKTPPSVLLDYSLTIGNYDAREFFAPHPINIFLIPSSRPGQAAIWIWYQTAASLFNYSLCNRDGTRICDWESVRDGLRLCDIGHAAARFTFLFFFLVKRETYSLCIQKHDTTFFHFDFANECNTRTLGVYSRVVCLINWNKSMPISDEKTFEGKRTRPGRWGGGGGGSIDWEVHALGKEPFCGGNEIVPATLFPNWIELTALCHSWFIIYVL